MQNTKDFLLSKKRLGKKKFGGKLLMKTRVGTQFKKHREGCVGSRRTEKLRSSLAGCTLRRASRRRQVQTEPRRVNSGG